MNGISHIVWVPVFMKAVKQIGNNEAQMEIRLAIRVLSESIGQSIQKFEDMKISKADLGLHKMNITISTDAQSNPSAQSRV